MGIQQPEALGVCGAETTPDSVGAALVVMGHRAQSPALTGEISPGKPETMTQMELWREAAAAHVSGSISLKYI